MEKEITTGKGNEIIRLFMEAPLFRVRSGITFHLWLNDEIPYHKDWSLLMPVVEKIESMGYKFQICRKRAATLTDDEFQTPVCGSKMDTKIQAAWETAILFIKSIGTH